MSQKFLQNQDLVLVSFSYLTHSDLARCEQVCRAWKHYINIDEYFKKKIFNHFSTQEINDDYAIIYYEWFQRHLVDVNEFIFHDLSGIFGSQHVFALVNKMNLTSLEITLDCDDFTSQPLLLKDLLSNQKQLKSFTTRGGVLCDQNLPCLAETSIDRLVVISNKNDKMFKWDHLEMLPPLRTLSLYPQILEFMNLLPLIVKSREILEEISLDGDDLDGKEISILLSTLNNKIVSKIQFQYCENFDDSHIMMLKYFPKLTILMVRKAKYVSSECFDEMVRGKSFKKLNLNCCELIQDSCIIDVALNSHKLILLDLGWCSNITNVSVRLIFQNCLHLQSVYLQGCKQLTQKCLPQFSELYDSMDQNQLCYYFKDIFQQKDNQMNGVEITLLWELKHLDFERCDFIPDTCLQLIKLYRREMEIKNYYGNLIQLL